MDYDEAADAMAAAYHQVIEKMTAEFLSNANWTVITSAALSLPSTNIIVYDADDFLPEVTRSSIMPDVITASSDPWDDITIVKKPLLPPVVASSCYLCSRRGPRLYVHTSGATICEDCGDELRDEVPKPR